MVIGHINFKRLKKMHNAYAWFHYIYKVVAMGHKLSLWKINRAKYIVSCCDEPFTTIIQLIYSQFFNHKIISTAVKCTMMLCELWTRKTQQFIQSNYVCSMFRLNQWAYFVMNVNTIIGSGLFFTEQILNIFSVNCC